LAFELLRAITNVPSSHDIAVSTKNLGKTANYNVCVREHVDVDEVPDRLVHYYTEVILVGQLANAFQVWRTKQRIPRELSEQNIEPFPSF
jgi:hypothetical protein